MSEFDEIFDASRRHALIVAVENYHDAQFRSLRSATRDATALRDTLGNPQIGAFTVTALIDETKAVIEGAVHDLCANATSESFIILYFSCHGSKDADGRLYLAARDTSHNRLPPTAVDSAYIQGCLNRCRSRQIALYLDCCYAAAFMRDLLPRGVVEPDIVWKAFQGEGRILVFASKATQWAFEANSPDTPSLFTGHFVEGLRSGDADTNGDGLVSVQESYEYIYKQLQGHQNDQTPNIFSRVEGELYLARAPARPGHLSSDLIYAINSNLLPLKLGGIAVLRDLVRGKDRRMARTAELALGRLLSDHVAEVARAARAALPLRSDYESIRLATASADVSAEPNESDDIVEFQGEAWQSSLPDDILVAILSSERALREGGVRALRGYSDSSDVKAREAAIAALQVLASDDDAGVAEMARAALPLPVVIPPRLIREPEAALGSNEESESRDLNVQQGRQWYKQAVFYEVLVRGFHDSNRDGRGDLRGLIARLDYLQWLGIDCVWLLPIYTSPLRDGGYDIADFMEILPEFGTIGDFVELVEAAHARGIRVVLDLVINHTSDQHPWFQASRSDPDGPFGDFYMWSDTDDKYPDARIIFVDTEQSNWTFDPVRGQYYWHRFFHHEPELNYENPRVQDAMLEVLRFWLDLGIDGFQLSNVPYLYAREGTNCENLKETHEYLKRIRAEVDRHYPDRVLLAEANQWPADVVEYFGDASVGGDECHMAFHFPLMPRIFMAVRREQRYPISEILAQTPEIPSGCQWGIFLRNHDELTLEMVTDDERDYMYAEYAKDPVMKANIGIRRRLAPLLDNDRNQLELFTALLLSLPGSPVLYYGDEIGMGDNIYLGDRDGVRTPMQWTVDRNGGFSNCDSTRLYLQPNTDPIYGYQAINVEAQERNAGSLLQRTRRMIEIRKRYPVFGLGHYSELTSSNPSVLAFIREYGETASGSSSDPPILCVNNLSRFPQPVELDLSRYRGFTPVECMGGVAFPPIGEFSYLMTIPGYMFYWFIIEKI